jgi:hypothetical protein
VGLLSDVFVADGAEAEAVVLQGGPMGKLPTFQAKGLDPVKLGTLEEIMTGTSFEAILEGLVGEHFEDEGGESGVFDVRPELVAAVASLTDDVVPTTAERWAQTEEWLGADAADLEPLIHGISTLAREAGRTDKRLWVWWSL